VLRFLIAFAFTQVVEIPIYWRPLEDARGGPRSALRVAVLAFGASLITHPFVWFAFPRLPFSSPLEMILAAEAFAVAVEAAYLAILRARRPLAWSLAANASSAGLGALSHWFFGLP
jgi:hypothetical protein